MEKGEKGKPIQEEKIAKIEKKSSGKSGKRKKIVIGVSVIAVIVIIILAVTLGVTLTKDKDRSSGGSRFNPPKPKSDTDLKKVLKDSLAEFQEIEKTSPRTGYEFSIEYDESGKKWTTQLIPKDTRAPWTPMPMPTKSTCPFCGNTPTIKFSKDLAISADLQRLNLKAVKSESNRMLIVPLRHVTHWFDLAAVGKDEEKLIELQKNIAEVALKITNYLRQHNGLGSEPFKYRLHIGTGGFQTVPHLHFRFLGELTDAVWTELMA